MTQGHLQAVQPPQSHHIIYHLGAFTGFSTYHSHFTLYTTQGHLQAVQPTTVTSHYIRLRGICRLFNPPQSHQIINPPQSHYIPLRGICSLFNPPFTLYTTQGHYRTQGHLQVTVQLFNTTVTSHYIRLRGICRLFNPPQSHHIIYDLGAFVGCSTHHSHITLYTTQGHLQPVQPTTVTSHYIRLRGICRLFNPPQSHHIIYDLGAFAGCSTHHSHITLYTTQGHLQAVQPTTVTSHYIPLRGIYRLLNLSQSLHIIYDLGAFAGCSTHHSHITLYTTQGHLQAFNPPQSHHIIYDLGAFAGCSTHHSHITLYTTQGHSTHHSRLFNHHSHTTLYTTGAFTGFSTFTVTSHYIRLRDTRLFNPQSHNIYDLGAGCSTHHSHITLYTTQGHLQAVQPPQSHHIIYDLGAFAGCSTHHSHITLYTNQGHLQAVQLSTVTSHYIGLRGICRLFNPPQSHHIIYDLGAHAGCSTTTVTTNYIRLRGICRLFNPPQSHHIIYDLVAFVASSTHHSHITLYMTQGHLQAVQPPQSHHIIYHLGAFTGFSTYHSHFTLYTTQGHLQAVQPTTVTPHYIPLRGIYRLLKLSQSLHIIYDLGAFAGCSTHHSHITLYTTQGHLQAVQPTTVTSHYI